MSASRAIWGLLWLFAGEEKGDGGKVHFEDHGVGGRDKADLADTDRGAGGFGKDGDGFAPGGIVVVGFHMGRLRA